MAKLNDDTPTPLLASRVMYVRRPLWLTVLNTVFTPLAP
jgi:hypothetical protein